MRTSVGLSATLRPCAHESGSVRLRSFFFFGFDPEFLRRAHGIGAKIICVHTGVDRRGSN